MLTALAITNQLPSIRNLASGFSGASEGAATILYLQSLSFTEYLIQRYRFYTLNALLDELGRGTAFEQAFETTYSMPVNRAERDWISGLPDS